MSFLSLIPLPYRLLATAAALVSIVVSVLIWGGHRERSGYAAGAASIQALWDADRARAAAAALAASEAARAEEQRRAAAQQEVVDAYEKELQRMRADVAIADAAAGRLRERVAALVAAARQAAGGASLAPGSPPADDATGMLADVLGRCISRVQLLARVADERGAAGRACERAYDALTPATAGSAPAPAAAD